MTKSLRGNYVSSFEKIGWVNSSTSHQKGWIKGWIKEGLVEAKEEQE